jgi:glycosyltransferase involved in cell wall biosynthesis
MSETNSRISSTIVINATNIGKKMNGIGVYTLSLLKTFARMQSGLRFIVYVNKNARNHLNALFFPPNFTLRWVSHRLSPDYRFPGHLLRLVYANYLSIKHRKRLIFTTSQLEACFFRSRQIITIHDVIPLLFKEHHKKQYPYFRYFLKFALKKAEYIITPSYHSQKLLKQHYRLPEHKIRVIPNGVQEIYKDPVRRIDWNRKDLILYTGRISPMKNIAGIIKAFHYLKDSLPHQLVLVGEEKSAIEREIRAGRLTRADVESDRIEFRGHISGSEMCHLLKRVSLLVFPSFYEGFGLPALEAMACGCPVVASNAASLPEVCGKAAYYVNPFSIRSIAGGIFQVITNLKIRRYLIRKGYVRVLRYSWDNSAKEHINIFRAALNARNVPLPVHIQNR